MSSSDKRYEKDLAEEKHMPMDFFYNVQSMYTQMMLLYFKVQLQWFYILYQGDYRVSISTEGMIWDRWQSETTQLKWPTFELQYNPQFQLMHPPNHPILFQTPQ